METGAGESRRPKHRVPDRSPGTRGGLVGLRLRRGLYKFGRPTNNFFASRPTPRPPQPPVVWTVSFTQAAGPRNPTYAYRGPGYYGYGARAGARASTGLPVSRLRAAKDSGMAAKRARNAGRGNEKGRECTSMVQVRGWVLGKTGDESQAYRGFSDLRILGQQFTAWDQINGVSQPPVCISCAGYWSS